MSMEYTSMSIASAGESTLSNQKNVPIPLATRDINRCDDIEGATSSVPYAARFSNKPETLPEVDGSTCKKRTHTRNVRDYSLYIDDIDGTRHSIKDRMMRTKRHVNPLVPEYELPSAISADIPEPKYIRSSLNVDDIDGAKPKSAKVYDQRDTMSTKDIEGAQACYRPVYRRARLQNPPHNIMNNDGVVLKGSRFQDRCKRQTDLNNPVYNVNGIVLKDEAESKPKPLKSYISDNGLLKTRDIEGAYPAGNKVGRREIRNIMSTMDIVGAQADTVVHSMKSDRVTNPLVPTYDGLDGNKLHALVTPLIPASMNNAPTLKPSKTSNTPASRLDVPQIPIPVATVQGKGDYQASSYADTVDKGETFV